MGRCLLCLSLVLFGLEVTSCGADSGAATEASARDCSDSMAHGRHQLLVLRADLVGVFAENSPMAQEIAAVINPDGCAGLLVDLALAFESMPLEWEIAEDDDPYEDSWQHFPGLADVALRDVPPRQPLGNALAPPNNLHRAPDIPACSRLSGHGRVR